MADADDDDELALPPAAEREAILEELAALVDARGYEHLVLAPLVAAEEAYFPDRWAGGQASVQRLLRRLFVYADLERIPAQVGIEDDLGLGAMSPAGIGAPAWFDKMDRGTVHMRVRQSSLRDPLVLVPALARTTAEAWRAHHGLALRDAMAEQRSVDITAIYLGFARLTVPASLRHGVQRGAGRARASVSRMGVLSPRTLAFAFATQCHARGLDAPQLRSLARELGGNTEAFFDAALVWLAARTPSVIDTLALPPRAQWADPPSLSLLTAPVEDEPIEGDEGSASESRHDEDRGVLGMNAGKSVFRVERSKALRLAKMFGLPILLLGMLAGRMQVGVEFEMWKAMSIAGGLALAGLAIGRLFPDARCSEPRCGEPLTKSQTTCPRCGGTIAGVISHPRERLAAEEALARRADESEPRS